MDGFRKEEGKEMKNGELKSALNIGWRKNPSRIYTPSIIYNKQFVGIFLEGYLEHG